LQNIPIYAQMWMFCKEDRCETRFCLIRRLKVGGYKMLDVFPALLSLTAMVFSPSAARTVEPDVNGQWSKANGQKPKANSQKPTVNSQRSTVNYETNLPDTDCFLHGLRRRQCAAGTHADTVFFQ
jgi:hypothetical protein